MSDTDLDVLDVDRGGVVVPGASARAASPTLTLLAICIATGVLFGLAFAAWWLIGGVLFGSLLPQLTEGIRYLLFAG